MSLSPSIASEPIAGYTIRDRIGAGGYGEVWTAEAPGGLEKAIKFVYGYLDEARASRELKALNRIKMVRHPFLLSLERIEIIDGQLLIVTELAEGSLKDRYEECRDDSMAGIPMKELMRYMGDAAEALDYMNERHGLQHLDVKPENLLLSAGRVKVADFGLVKDLQDVNVSLMGGLTPAYAAPEVFNSQPSTRSDQYSLAILFQELLTGVLPFPGRSAAQLASQHMSSRPNVSSLPEVFRPVILRALAKDPEQRFASCVELVEQLKLDHSAPKPREEESSEHESHSGPSSSGSKAKNLATQQMQSKGEEQSPESQVADAKPASSRSSAKSPLHARVSAQLKRELKQPMQAEVQPPYDTSAAVNLRPQVIISLGGAGALTTQAFLTEMERRHGELESLPAIQWLYLDADNRLPREVEEAGYQAPSHDRMVIAPLRNVQDYRSGSQNYLKWLSRRWLYNIPKSQTPESLRPLGRLAFIDKKQEVCAKLSEVIQQAIDPEAIAATAQAMGTAFDKRLRIMVVASSAGGVGGGALLDVGDWIREVLASQNISADLQALLLHGTGRQSNRQDLAVANTFATLSELHDRMRRQWAGEAEQQPPFDEINLHLLGEHLAPEQWKEQTRSAARYLSLLLSTAGARWDKARQTEAQFDETPPVSISSFQATVIGKSSDGLTDQLLDSIQANVVNSWRLGTVVTSKGAETTDMHADLYQQCIDAAGELAGGLQLEYESLLGEMNSCLEKTAGGSLSSKIVENWQGVLGIAELPSIEAEQLFQAQRMAQEFLGIDVEGSREFAEIDPLDKRADPLVSRFLRSRGGAVRELISCLAEQPASGIAGADRAADSLRERLATLKQQLSESHDKQRAESTRLGEAIRATTIPQPQERGKVEGPPREALLMQFVNANCQRLAMRKALQVVRALDDVIAELKRNLASLDRELAALLPEKPAELAFEDQQPVADEGKQTKLLRQAAEQLLEKEHYQVAVRIDVELRKHALETLGGFSAIVLEGKSLMHQLDEPLRLAVRSQVEQAVQEIRLTEIVSLQQNMSQVQSPDQSESAELLQCGGKARWLLMLPEGSPDSTLPTQVAERIGSQPAVDYHPAGEVTLFCLGEQIPLSRVGAHLIGHAGQFVEIATRLHTRGDVNWLPLFEQS